MAARARILVVEDSPDLRFLYRLMLERAGYEVVGEADNGASALALAPELSPDVIVLDVVLPDVPGLEVARRLRPLLPEARIVVCSGAGPEMAEAAADAGADSWLDKTQSYELVPTIERLLTGGV